MVTARQGPRTVGPKPGVDRVRELLQQAVGCLNVAIDAIVEGTDSDPDNILQIAERARGTLLRALATPEQREQEFQRALRELTHEESLAGLALREHVLELAWQDALRQYAPGASLLEGGDPSAIGRELASRRRTRGTR